jgi:hypothetical protein
MHDKSLPDPVEAPASSFRQELVAKTLPRPCQDLAKTLPNLPEPA